MKKYTLIALFSFIMLSATVAQEWKTYPYHPDGSVIYFPTDEGVHPAEPSEWWYTVAHVTGQTTGTEYTFMLTYFNYSYGGFDGFRIFNLSNEDENIFYQETLPVNYDLLAEDSLHILAQPSLGPQEYWMNKTNPIDGSTLPFQYSIHAQQQHGAIDIDLDAFKPPLILGDSGLFNQGIMNYTYYYSQTGLNVSGEITFDDLTESITGLAWIDRQYGSFDPNTGEKYEWFCVQLSNGMDFNIFNIFTHDDQIPDTSTYKMCAIYFDENSDTTISDYSFDRLSYSFMPDKQRCYSQSWRLQWDNIDLTITALNPYNEVTLPFRFYEGSTEITGTVDGIEVSGIGFAELLHSYSNPQLEFVNPDSAVTWNKTGNAVAWNVNNPDDGNPLYYTLSFSVDGGNSFEDIAVDIQDTSYLWDYSNIPDSTYCFFKLSGYSIDGTLADTIFSDSVFIDINTGIDELFSRSNVLVYPNPSTGIVHIIADEISRIEVLTLSGQTIYRKNFQFLTTRNNTVTINLENQPESIYIVKTVSAGQINYKKLVIGTN
jgi:predicted secreted hydrolase